MDIHKQAIKKKYRQVELERQAVRTKATRSAFCLHTVNQTQTSFYCGFDRYKVMDCFQVQLVN